MVSLDKKKLKKRMGILFAIAIICVLAALGTLAILNKTLEVKENQFQVGRTGITVEENDPVTWEEKQVWLKASNDPGCVDGVVRVMLIPRVLYSDGAYAQVDFGEIQPPMAEQMIMGDIGFVLSANWQQDWFYKDGYFYYKKVLAPGEETPVLLERAVILGDKNKYKDLEIKIDVLADIIQAQGNAAPQEWGVTVTGKVVANKNPGR